MKKLNLFIFIVFGIFAFISPALADNGLVEPVSSTVIPSTFLWLAVILLFARLSSIIIRLGQPAVLGELIIGVLLGNLALIGLDVFEPIKQDIFISFLAELGVIILLFQIGLESNLEKMEAVGLRAFLVACVGVVVPFVLGTYVVGPYLLPGLTFNAYLFLGATLTATSVGITARVFQDLGKLQTKEAQIVLGAAVIDDVLGLIILAIVSAIATTGSISPSMIALISLKAFAFLIGSIFFGRLFAPYFGKFLSKINETAIMKMAMALIFCFTFAYLSQWIGLAPIVGAFAAGLLLDPVHFKNFRKPSIVSDVKTVLARECTECSGKLKELLEFREEKHIESLIRPVGYFLIPIFFVFTGMSVRLETLFDLNILLLALGITVVAFIGKIVAGLVAGDVDKWIVGVGMIPRGEVGLIFIMMGKTLGVISDQIFSAIVVVIILSTLLTPPILSYLIKRKYEKEKLS